MPITQKQALFFPSESQYISKYIYLDTNFGFNYKNSIACLQKYKNSPTLNFFLGLKKFIYLNKCAINYWLKKH